MKLRVHQRKKWIGVPVYRAVSHDRGELRVLRRLMKSRLAKVVPLRKGEKGRAFLIGFNQPRIFGEEF